MRHLLAFAEEYVLAAAFLIIGCVINPRVIKALLGKENECERTCKHC
jgi:hypothetical protein